MSYVIHLPHSLEVIVRLDGKEITVPQEKWRLIDLVRAEYQEELAAPKIAKSKHSKNGSGPAFSGRANNPPPDRTTEAFAFKAATILDTKTPEYDALTDTMLKIGWTTKSKQPKEAVRSALSTAPHWSKNGRNPQYVGPDVRPDIGTEHRFNGGRTIDLIPANTRN